MPTRVSLPPSVLLVNDVPDEREMYVRTLRAAGYRAITAESSAAAYQMATASPPDIVVTDVRMTGSISGLELTRRLRNDQRTPTIGIIVLTTKSRPQDADAARKAGAHLVLEKPVPASVVKAEIGRLLATSRQRFSGLPPQRDRAHAADALRQGHTTCTPRFTNETRCPSCDSNVVYRERWPVLNADGALATVERERLRYVAGWFCTSPTCDFRRLSDDVGRNVSSDSNVGNRS
jgi:CheY-like chemotaxis protein